MEGSRELPSIIRFDLWFDFPLIVITKIYYPKLLGAEQPHWIQTITSQSHFQGYLQRISELFLENRSSIINSDKKVWWFLPVKLAVQSCMLIIWLWTSLIGNCNIVQESVQTSFACILGQIHSYLLDIKIYHSVTTIHRYSVMIG